MIDESTAIHAGITVMSELASFLNILHVILTAGFVVVTCALLGISILNRIRVRAVVLAWRPGGFRSFPFGPALFALLIAGFEVIAVLSGGGIPTHLLIGYGAGSIAWFAAAWISSTALVSECGVVADIHRDDLFVSWGRVTDYFEFDNRRGRGIVLLHRCASGQQKRLELEVPDAMRCELIEIVDMHLRRRFDRSDRRTQDKTALEG